MIPGEKQGRKVDFPCSHKKMKNEKWSEGVVTSICAKKNGLRFSGRTSLP